MIIVEEALISFLGEEEDWPDPRTNEEGDPCYAANVHIF